MAKFNFCLYFFLRHKHIVIELAIFCINFLRELFHFRYRRGMLWCHKGTAAQWPPTVKHRVGIGCSASSIDRRSRSLQWVQLVDWLLPKWKSGVHMLSLPLCWLTVVTREKARVAASASLEAPFVWIKSITVWLVVVRKVSLLEEKVGGSASKPFVDYNCLPIEASSYSVWSLPFLSNNNALLQPVRQQHNSTIYTWFQCQCLLLHELFPLSQQSINAVAEKACALHFFT